MIPTVRTNKHCATFLIFSDQGRFQDVGRGGFLKYSLWPKKWSTLILAQEAPQKNLTHKTHTILCTLFLIMRNLCIILIYFSNNDQRH